MSTSRVVPTPSASTCARNASRSASPGLMPSLACSSVKACAAVPRAGTP
ncbi:Uncharacterised protein [Mycobacteroides abscessus subsp. abscessus]|nr:Uncharacterised protein [Mycobacteroides abscessus subsp. abscessus]SKU55028.1 Uncharacterised protein [Mycobacteroides abscessus subsp. abscessus]